MEIWKDIPGYEGLYQVSNYGNGRSLDRQVEMKTRCGGTFTRLFKGKEIVKSKYPNGYLFFSVHKNGILKQILVHRAVAKAFIPNPDNLPEVNHKDECKTNNVVENLEWCDKKYNSTYNERHIKIGRKLRNRPDFSKKVYKYSRNNELVAEYPSASEAARQNNTYPPCIINSCNGGYYDKKHHRLFGVYVKDYRYSYERL